MYRLLRELLFLLPAEGSHHLSLASLALARRLGLSSLLAAKGRELASPKTVMGLEFPNVVGLAAGLDKNGDYIDALAALGFGFIEIGTLTPRPQPGNPKPRLFRLPDQLAIINRMGFNNKGIDHAIGRVIRSAYQGVLGINIGKNFDTPLELAADDYVHCLKRCHQHASYVTVNLSSPNTPGLRELQFGDYLDRLLDRLQNCRAQLERDHRRRVPLVVKLAPDLSADEIVAVCDIVLRYPVDGIIATNTTMDRSAITAHPLASETGGLSGRPLTEKSTAVIRLIHQAVSGKIPIIGVGGIMSGEDALEKLQAGASLVQIYTGFIYSGPQLITDIIRTVHDGSV